MKRSLKLIMAALSALALPVLGWAEDVVYTWTGQTSAAMTKSIDLTKYESIAVQIAFKSLGTYGSINDKDVALRIGSAEGVTDGFGIKYKKGGGWGTYFFVGDTTSDNIPTVGSTTNLTYNFTADVSEDGKTLNNISPITWTGSGGATTSGTFTPTASQSLKTSTLGYVTVNTSMPEEDITVTITATPIPERVTYVRTIDTAEADWSADAAWAKETDATATATVPVDDNNVTLTVDADSTITMNAAATLHELTIAGSAKATFAGENTLIADTTAINTDTDVTGITANLGVVTVEKDVTLTVGPNTSWTSISGDGVICLNGTELNISSDLAANIEIGANGATITAVSGHIALTGVISGSGALTLNGGTGSLAIKNASNTYSGDATIASGIVYVGNYGNQNSGAASAFPAKSITVKDKASFISHVNTSALTWDFDIVLEAGATLGIKDAIGIATGDVTFAGDLAINGDATFTFHWCKGGKITGVISGTGTLTINENKAEDGTSTLKINNAENTFTGTYKTAEVQADNTNRNVKLIVAEGAATTASISLNASDDKVEFSAAADTVAGLTGTAGTVTTSVDATVLTVTGETKDVSALTLTNVTIAGDDTPICTDSDGNQHLTIQDAIDAAVAAGEFSIMIQLLADSDETVSIPEGYSVCIADFFGTYTYTGVVTDEYGNKLTATEGGFYANNAYDASVTIDGTPTKYETLAAAYAAATDGATITISPSGLELDSTWVIEKDIILDLNNTTLEAKFAYSTANPAAIWVKNGGKLTLQNNGTLLSAAEAIRIGVKGSTDTETAGEVVILDSSTDKDTIAPTVRSSDIAIMMYGASKLTSEGEIVSTTSAAIQGNGLETLSTEITILKGTVQSNADVAIYHPQPGTLNIGGDESDQVPSISGQTGIELRAGTINMKNGWVSANAGEYSVTANGNGSTVIGAALAISQHTTGHDIAVNVTGGTFMAYGYALAVVNTTDDDPITVTGSIVGTAFPMTGYDKRLVDISSVTLEGDSTDGYTFVSTTPIAQVGEETYTSLTAALEAVTEPDTTITLLTDVTVAAALTVDKSATLAIGEHTLTIPAPQAITVAADKTLKVTCGTGGLVVGGTIAVNGTLDVSELAYGPTGLVSNQPGSLKIGATGTVKLMSSWNTVSVNWMQANRASFFSGTVSGAKVLQGEVASTYNGTLWLKDDTTVSATITANGQTYTEAFATLKTALAETPSAITLLKNTEVAEDVELTLPVAGAYTVTVKSGATLDIAAPKLNDDATNKTFADNITIATEEGATVILTSGGGYFNITGEGTVQAVGGENFIYGLGGNNTTKNTISADLVIPEGKKFYVRAWSQGTDLGAGNITVNGTIVNSRGTGNGADDVAISLASGKTLSGTGTIDVPVTLADGAIVDAPVTITGTVTQQGKITIDATDLGDGDTLLTCDIAKLTLANITLSGVADGWAFTTNDAETALVLVAEDDGDDIIVPDGTTDEEFDAAIDVLEALFAAGKLTEDEFDSIETITNPDVATVIVGCGADVKNGVATFIYEFKVTDISINEEGEVSVTVSLGDGQTFATNAVVYLDMLDGDDDELVAPTVIMTSGQQQATTTFTKEAGTQLFKVKVALGNQPY